MVTAEIRIFLLLVHHRHTFVYCTSDGGGFQSRCSQRNANNSSLQRSSSVYRVVSLYIQTDYLIIMQKQSQNTESESYIRRYSKILKISLHSFFEVKTGSKITSQVLLSQLSSSLSAVALFSGAQIHTISQSEVRTFSK